MLWACLQFTNLSEKTPIIINCFLSCLCKKGPPFPPPFKDPWTCTCPWSGTFSCTWYAGGGKDTSLLGINNVALDTFSFPLQIKQYIMRLVILDNYDKLSEWAAKYVRNRILKFNPGPDKYFVLGLPTGKYFMIIPWACSYLISNKRKWNDNCFIKNTQSFIIFESSLAVLTDAHTYHILVYGIWAYIPWPVNQSNLWNCNIPLLVTCFSMEDLSHKE